MNDLMISAKGIKKGFPMPDGDTFWALKGLDIEIPRQKLTILRGRSGSGKTTLMNILGALDDPTEGSLVFDGEDITEWNETKKGELRLVYRVTAKGAGTGRNAASSRKRNSVVTGFSLAYGTA